MSNIIPQTINTSRLSSANSTATPLGSSGVFTGAWERTLDYGIIFVNVYADQASATDGLQIQQSSDGINADHQDVFTIAAATGKNFSLNPHALYFRIVYTNGGSAQASFRLQTLYKLGGKPSSHRVADSISGQDDAELGKTVLAGEDPNGDFINFGATMRGNFPVSINEFGDTSSIDAFDRLRVSNPYTIFDSKQLHDSSPLFFDQSLGGSATSSHSTNDARTRLSVTASSSDFAIRQTKQRFNYQPGKSLLLFGTLQASMETGITKRIGFFDGTGTNFMTPNNGIWLEVNGTTPAWKIAKNGTTTENVAQSAWNTDPLDGTGPSGLTLDMDGMQIMIIDLEWLGSGRVRVGFMIKGLIRYVHNFDHANNALFPTVYMSTPNLPVRYDIQSDGSGAGDLDHICSTVMSEGGIEKTGISRAIDTETTHLDANTADTPYVLLALRLKSTHLDITVLPEYMSMISETNDNFRWSLHLNPTYNGSLTYNDVDNSACQYAAGATANDITDQGIKMDAGYAQSAATVNRQFQSTLRIGSMIDGTPDELVLAVTPLSANADIQGSLSYRELL
jgi:hypothetical protein